MLEILIYLEKSDLEIEVEELKKSDELLLNAVMELSADVYGE